MRESRNAAVRSFLRSDKNTLFFTGEAGEYPLASFLDGTSTLGGATCELWFAEKMEEKEKRRERGEMFWRGM